MKKLLALLMTLIIFGSLTACAGSSNSGTNESDRDSDDHSSESSDSVFDSDGYSSESSDVDYDYDYYDDYNDYNEEPSIRDYSNYGFYDADLGDTWIQFDWGDHKSYDFSDKDNAYVITWGGDYATLKFNNGTLKQERWDRSDNKGIYYDINNEFGGYLHNASTYKIVDNYTLTFTSGFTTPVELTIADKQIVKGVPMIYFYFERHHYSDPKTSSGYYIPADIVDWSRSPQSEDNRAKYYILPEYIE